MIVAIEGEVVKKDPSFVYIKTNGGLVYKVFLSLNTSSKIEEKHLFSHISVFCI